MNESVPTTSRPHPLKKIILTVVIVPLALFLALFVISFVLQVFERSSNIRQGNYSLDNTPSQTEASYGGDRQKLVEGQNNYWFGSENPKVTVVEFGDFACPYCKSSFPAVREIGVRYKDDVKIIYRDWPGHEYSVPLALAAYCAGEQGKFWEMYDKLFQNQSDTFGQNKNDLAVLAQQLGIYNTEFQTCFDSQKYLPQIRANFLDSQTLGVRGTPTWFINGEKVEGALTTEELETFITQKLK